MPNEPAASDDTVDDAAPGGEPEADAPFERRSVGKTPLHNLRVLVMELASASKRRSSAATPSAPPRRDFPMGPLETATP